MSGRLIVSSCLRAWVVCALIALWPSPVSAQALDENCTATILNRTVPVFPDGSFGLVNVPYDPFLHRVRVICQGPGGTTLQGHTTFLFLALNDVTDVPGVDLVALAPIPASLAITASPTTLVGAGATTMLTVTATLPDTSTTDVTLESAGTGYRSSNAGIATVSVDGLVTAVASGTAIVSVTNEGVLAAIMIMVIVSDDTDMDGLPDDYELANGLNPNDPADAVLDPDSDGLTNLEEFNNGTLLLIPDTDADGLNDGAEVSLGTDPLQPDSDMDGVIDGDESVFGSLPLDQDSDGDGLPDGVEVAISGNPFDALPGADDDGDSLTNIDEVALSTDPTNPDTDADGLDDGLEGALGTDPLIAEDLSQEDITIDGFTATLNEPLTFGSLTLINGAVVNHSQAMYLTSTTNVGVELNISGELMIDATSSIDLTGRGYVGGYSSGNPGPQGRTATNRGGAHGAPGASGAGGSHGGLGGPNRFGEGLQYSVVYGDFRDPDELGSGGYSENPAGPAPDGGGRVRITAASAVIDGAIRVDGAVFDFETGGASGGSILLDVGTLTGTGIISANGSGRVTLFSGGGGGGRIAIHYENMAGFLGTISAQGGPGTPVSGTEANGGAGTIFMRDKISQVYGDLTIDNAGMDSYQLSTPMQSIGVGTSTSLSANSLADGGATFPTPDDSGSGFYGGTLVGLELNPNVGQGQTFTVIDNSTTDITTDAADGDMTLVASTGNTYIGVYTLDNLTIINNSRVITDDDLIVLGTLFVDVTSSLNSNNHTIP